MMDKKIPCTVPVPREMHALFNFCSYKMFGKTNLPRFFISVVLRSIAFDEQMYNCFNEYCAKLNAEGKHEEREMLERCTQELT